MFSHFAFRDRRRRFSSRSRRLSQRYRPLVEVLEERDVPSTVFVVNTTADNGGLEKPAPLSLRKAITEANDVAGPVLIQFNIPGAVGQVFTITPRSPLPSLENRIEIDGTSQRAFNGGTIVLSGAALTHGGDGLVLDAAHCIVQGMVVNGFSHDAAIETTDETSDCLIQNNFIGTNAAGTSAVSNDIGVEVCGDHNTISGNLISGNQLDGIRIDGCDATNNLIASNLIGTDVTGLVALPNGTGVRIDDGASQNTIGGPSVAEGNVIAANNGDGVLIQAPTGEDDGDHDNDVEDSNEGPSYNSIGGVLYPGIGNLIESNFIGTDRSATLPLGNGGDGVDVDGSSGNRILANAVFDNGDTSIALLDAGNDMQAAPQITAATYDGSTLTISWSLSSPATAGDSFRIEFFASSLGDSADGTGAGQQFLGFVTIGTDDNGQASGTITFSNVALVGPYLTATATDTDTLNTSPFSGAFAVPLPTPTPPVSAVPVPPPTPPALGKPPPPIVASDSSPPIAILLPPPVQTPVQTPAFAPTFDVTAIASFFAAGAVVTHNTGNEGFLLSHTDVIPELSLFFLPKGTFSTDPYKVAPSSRANSTCTITGVIFQDNNGDGVRESGEPPLEGMCVYLERIDGGADPDAPCPVAYTDSNGQYKFEGLAPGAYVVRPMQHRLFRVSAPQHGFERVNLPPETTATVPFGCKPQRPSSDGDPDSDARPLPGRERWLEARDALFISDAAPWWGGLALAGALVGVALSQPNRWDEE